MPDVKFLFEGYPGTCHVDFTAKNLYRPSVVGNNVNFQYVSGYSLSIRFYFGFRSR